MIWWQWIVIGALLLSAEIAVDAQFYLVFVGVAAIGVGLVGASGLDLSISVQWLLFAVLSAASLILFRQQTLSRLRGTPAGIAEGVVGDVAIADEEIGAGQSGRVQLRGTSWTARNIGPESIPAGARARVVEASGVGVVIRLER